VVTAIETRDRNELAQAGRSEERLRRVRYLQYQLKLQGDAMRRRGIDEDLVQRELWCMASAIRAAFAQNVADNPGGGA
jgi:hypothetical protein